MSTGVTSRQPEAAVVIVDQGIAEPVAASSPALTHGLDGFKRSSGTPLQSTSVATKGFDVSATLPSPEAPGKHDVVVAAGESGSESDGPDGQKAQFVNGTRGAPTPASTGPRRFVVMLEEASKLQLRNVVRRLTSLEGGRFRFKSTPFERNEQPSNSHVPAGI
jgi:hypothetical protein